MSLSSHDLISHSFLGLDPSREHFVSYFGEYCTVQVWARHSIVPTLQRDASMLSRESETEVPHPTMPQQTSRLLFRLVLQLRGAESRTPYSTAQSAQGRQWASWRQGIEVCRLGLLRDSSLADCFAM